MVSTRNHPKAFPPPQVGSATSTPTKSSHRSSRGRGSNDSASWTHTPSRLTLAWLAVSLPIVLWDVGYIMLRPWSMPGGALHWPVYSAYKLYGDVDHLYGFPAYAARDGFPAAQSALNLIETAMYAAYLWVVWRFGDEPEVEEGDEGEGMEEEEGMGEEQMKGRGAPEWLRGSWIARPHLLDSEWASRAVVLGFAASVMTLSKTVLYALNEVCSGFGHTGHNGPLALIFVYIIPNGMWLFFSSYMVYIFGQEILQGLEMASGESKKSR